MCYTFWVKIKGKIPTKMVLGVPIAALRLKEIAPVIVKLIEEGEKKTFFSVDAHHLNIAKKDPLYKKILQKATLAYAAGIGPILASRMLGQSLPQRTPPEDFIHEVFASAEKSRWSFYLLGGEDGIAEKAAENLRKRFPKLEIAGVHNGYFNDNKVVVEKINQASPDIVLVGMGAPRQEKWIVDNIDKVNASAFWTVGGLFEVLAGKRKRAPLWMQRFGLEWSFRLFQEPRRLWKRYIFGNAVFLFTVLQERRFSSRRTNR